MGVCVFFNRTPPKRKEENTQKDSGYPFCLPTTKKGALKKKRHSHIMAWKATFARNMAGPSGTRHLSSSARRRFALGAQRDEYRASGE